ncbi:RpiB/LacA/LacB family sugar-phosphate isomerase [Candidatus Beckwithbacteria bacterium]|nr:RpiB/LacA/LacB family sugar-phosphate isomerase [Candidatus Beckwithbacteria bacterium]
MLYLATDHRGYKLKNQLKAWLIAKKIKFKDLGAYEFNSNDNYPDFAHSLSQKVLEQADNKGVLFCGSGAGVCIAANKIKGIRACLGFNHRQVASFVKDDNVNVLCVAADYTNKFKCFQLVKTFLKTKFSGEEKYQRRIEKIEKLYFFK